MLPIIRPLNIILMPFERNTLLICALFAPNAFNVPIKLIFSKIIIINEVDTLINTIIFHLVW